jgi:DNA polymerase III delta prime subunit
MDRNLTRTRVIVRADRLALHAPPHQTNTTVIPASRTEAEDCPKKGESPPQRHREHLHTKYRPRELRDVRGQGPILRSLENALNAESRPHCFLFTGPPGTGKTTLARIVSSRLDIPARSILELDAAIQNGVDDVRRLCEGLRYAGWSDSPNKAIIFNECHRLSKPAWDALLMSTEEPPSHVFFFFTSTVGDDVPAAMVTRCVDYRLLPLDFDDIMDELKAVVHSEGYRTSIEVLELLAAAAKGSMRAALTGLAKVHACEDIEDARQLLHTEDEETPAMSVGRFAPRIHEVCRKLVAGKLEFREVCEFLSSAEKRGIQPERVRLVIVNDLYRRILSHRSEKEALRHLDLQALFMKPATGADKFSPLLQAFGDALFG